MIRLSYINLWNRGEKTIFIWFSNFIKENIGEVTHIKPIENPDILLCSCFGHINNIKKINAKIKIFFYGENLNRFPPYNNIELLKLHFDLIVGFRYTDISNKILRLPLWLCYYPYYNINDKNNNIITYLESENKKNININKSIFGSLIARHDRTGERKILLNELEKYGNIICPSKFNNNYKKLKEGNEAKKEFLQKCIYNICPENSKYEGYFTEKIFQAFESGTIPIYWAIEEPEKEILNKNKYCFIKNINDKNEVFIKIKDVVENKNKYLYGNIFNKYSYEIISKYYDDLKEEIKKLL